MTPPRNQAAVNALRMIPAKWAVVIVGVAITYIVLQPRLNQWFGWRLPSVASMMGDEKPTKKTQGKESATLGTTTRAEKEIDEPETKATPKKTVNETAKKSAREASIPDDEVAKPTQSTRTPTKSNTSANDDSDPLYGYLKEVGRNRYESPAGLVYGPGSEEGHRLRHIERHLEDQPDRPGSHGVFKGGMKEFLKAIDDGFTRAQKGAKGTTMTEDDGSTVYEVAFDKAIGFIGGEAGGRKRNPPAKKLRLVVRGKNVITAFPF
jgi:hypothetical protein